MVDNEIKVFAICDKSWNTLNIEHYLDENSNEFIWPFILNEGPLIRVGFVNNEVLIIVVHRIIIDQRSVEMILSDLEDYYNNTFNPKSNSSFNYYVNTYNKELGFGLINDFRKFI